MPADVPCWSERHALTCTRLDEVLHTRQTDRPRAVWVASRGQLLAPMTTASVRWPVELGPDRWVTAYQVGTDGLGYVEVPPEWLHLVRDTTPTLEAVLYTRTQVVLLPAGLHVALRLAIGQRVRSYGPWTWITERMTREEYERARTLLKLGGESAARDYLRAAAGM